MTKKRTLFSTLSLIFIIGLVVFPIFGLSLTRQEYTVDFIESTQDEIWGAFSEYSTYPEAESETETTLSTRSAVVGLNLLNALDDVGTTSTKNWLLDRINWGIDYNSLENISESVESLYYVDLEELEDFGRVDDIMEYSENRSNLIGNTIGYALDVGLNASLFGTYYVVKTYYFLDIIAELNVSKVSAFVIDSLNTNGGFKSSPNETESSLSTTFYAVQTLWFLSSLNLLTANNKTLISQYLNQFYVFDTSLEAHHGGYSYIPEEEIPFATVRATFDAAVTLSLLGQSIPNQQTTINWLLQNQNQEDGGFSENVLDGNEKKSSTITTYQTIRILSELGGLDSLSEQFGDLKLRWWIVLIVVIVLLGAGVGGLIYYQRRIKL